MIFDSEEIEALRTSYADMPDERIPFLLLLDRRDKFDDERKLLEDSIQKVSAKKQKEWLGCLFSKDEEQFQSAWFEIMLSDWLKSVGLIEVEPELLGNYPDFVVTANGQKVVIEAKALLVDQEDRQQDAWKISIFNAIKSIEMPYDIEVTAARLKAQPDTGHFTRKVHTWLTNNPQDKLIFEDKHGNIIVCESHYSADLNKLLMSWVADNAIFVNPDIIKPSLKKKAYANQAIRRAEYPYVITLYIEDIRYDAEDVIRAWFGNEVVRIDVENQQVIDRIRDDSGLHNFRGKAMHKSVSGTIVFKSEWGKDFKGRQLHGRFIENPYAKVKVDPEIFPVEGKFVVIGKSETGYKMAWR